MRKKIYLANGLFSEADYLYNELIAKSIEKLGKFNLYVPQRNESINDKTRFADSIAIYHGDRHELMNSDILLCVIDGPTVDAGTAAEIGWYSAVKEFDGGSREIIALYTDSREASKTFSMEKATHMSKEVCENQFSYVNLFIPGMIKANGGKIFTSRKELMQYLKNM